MKKFLCMMCSIMLVFCFATVTFAEGERHNGCPGAVAIAAISKTVTTLGGQAHQALVVKPTFSQAFVGASAVLVGMAAAHALAGSSEGTGAQLAAAAPTMCKLFVGVALISCAVSQ